MEIIQFLIDLLKDPRTFIAQWIVDFGPVWVYTPLFIIVFIETGLVVTPFLPGDSLLFCAGIFAADGGGLNIFVLIILMSIAAILGNTSNYWIGRKVGEAIVRSGKVKALSEENLHKSQRFFDKYGSLAVFLTRFFPIIRTIAPFVAGMGEMSFPRFTFFNVIGGIVWVSLFSLLGYFFGGVPFVEEHFELVIVGIVVISLIPIIAGGIKAKLSSSKKKKAAAADMASDEAAAADMASDEVAAIDAAAGAKAAGAKAAGAKAAGAKTAGVTPVDMASDGVAAADTKAGDSPAAELEEPTAAKTPKVETPKKSAVAKTPKVETPKKSAATKISEAGKESA